MGYEQTLAWMLGAICTHIKIVIYLIIHGQEQLQFTEIIGRQAVSYASKIHLC